MRNFYVIFIVLSLLTTSTSGCDKSKHNSNGNIEGLAGADNNANMKESQRADLYLKALAELQKMVEVKVRLESILDEYKKQQLAKSYDKVLLPTVMFDIKNINDSVALLQKAKNLDAPKADPALENAVENMLTVASKFSKTLVDLDKFIAAEDSGDKQKRIAELDAKMIQEGTNFVSAYHLFARECTAERVRRNGKLIEKYIAQGKTRQAAAREAFVHAEEFYNLIVHRMSIESVNVDEANTYLVAFNDSLEKFKKINTEIDDVKSPKFISVEDSFVRIKSLMNEVINNHFDVDFVERYSSNYREFVRHSLNIGLLD